MGKLDGKVAIVTGTSSGMGKATAELFAKEGASVVMAARRAECGQAMEAKMREAGYDVMYVKTDVSNREDCFNLVEKTILQYGKIDILANVAGTNSRCFYDLHDASVELRDMLIRTNFTSVIDMCTAVIPHMIKQGSGSIVNVSSVSANIAMPKDCLYAAVKGAVKSLSISMGALYGPMGIRVNCLCPGLTATELTEDLKTSPFAANILGHLPLGRFADPEEMAKAILFLSSEDSTFACGTVLTIDGGEEIS